TQLQIVSMLQTSGVDSVADLKYVQQEDIKGLLLVIQQRKLLEAFRLVFSETKTIILDLQVIQTDSDSSASTHRNPPPPPFCQFITTFTTKTRPAVYLNKTYHGLTYLWCHGTRCRRKYFQPLQMVSSTSADIERKVTVPASPWLILL
ncbi:hypothetical protein NFI96_029724, partial [Prochilodus magdalenae]